MREQSAVIQHAVGSVTTHQVIMQTVYSILKLCLGTMYPAYNSYKAMQSMSMVELVHCLTYWIVFSVLTLCEQLFDGLLGDVLPFYYEFKIIFIIWLVSPVTTGYSFIFTRSARSCREN